MTQLCGHTPYEVLFRWQGYGGPVTQKLCGVCASIVWNKLPAPLKETFYCEEIV
jgi:hypothetical protein